MSPYLQKLLNKQMGENKQVSHAGEFQNIYVDTALQEVENDTHSFSVGWIQWYPSKEDNMKAGRGRL